ncbi:uncharacterized protein LOC144819187 [Lissotriton helveticus]
MGISRPDSSNEAVHNHYQPPVPTGPAGDANAAIQEGTGAAAPAVAPVGEETSAVGGDTPSQKPSRKELVVRARQRKLQAIVEDYRRLVTQAEEEGEEAAAAPAASSNAPGPSQAPPPEIQRRG